MKSDTRSFYQQTVQRVVERIVGNLDGALDMHTLAAEACLSPFHFHRVFRGMVGETPVELMRRLRLERAAWRLTKEGNPAITQLAFEAGYETHEAFTRAFRAAYGAPPSGFRHRKIKRVELAAPCGVHFSTSLAAGGAIPVFIPCDSGGNAMQVDIISLHELRVGAVSHIGPYNQIASAFAKLGELVIDRTDLFMHAYAGMVAIYRDDPEATPPDRLRSEAGLILPVAAALPAGLAEHRIPAGRYARTTHIGPYTGLGDTWLRFMGEWIPTSGHRLGDGASFELYKNDPRTTPAAELRTEIYVSIAEAAASKQS
jgi:AraC family transcriptional regulator